MIETTWTLRGLPFAAIEWGQRPAGPDGDPPIVLLHGFLDHAGSWLHVAGALPGWRLALDHRGHGRSPWAAAADTYHFPDYLADLDALLVAIGRPVHLVGHSMGGTMASLYAGARPDRVASLVLVDGLGMPDGEGQAADRMEAYLDGVASPPVSKVYPSVSAAAARLQRTYPEIDEGFARYLAERGTIPAGEGVCWSYDPRHRIRGAIPYRHAHHLPLLARIRCPVLTVHPGVPTFRPSDITILEAAIPRLSRVTIPGTTHMIHLQAPDALASAIASFITTGAASQA